jgi:hypothetical protein
MNMMRLRYSVLLFIPILTTLSIAATVQDFQGGTGRTAYTLNQYENAPGAAVVNSTLLMVNTNSQRNVIAFHQSDPGLYSRIVAEWDMSIVAGADGLGFALLDTGIYGSAGAGPNFGEEPSLAAAFAVGFDIYCPDDYQNKGSHEISLHWDGVERANEWSPFDYRSGSFNRIRVIVDFVAGGAEVTVSVSGTVVYDKYFLAGMTPYSCRAAFGARTGGYKTTLYIDNVNIVFENTAQPPESPLSMRTYNRELMNGAHRDVSRVFNFPADNTVYERVVLKLTVEQPSGGWDGWDRMMGIYIWDQAQQNRFEIARFMTPYSKAGTWWIDVTDYQTLLRGSRKMDIWVDSWVGWGEEQIGYLFTTDFYYHKGSPKYRVIGIQNLWKGTPTYGNLNDPTMSNFFADKQISIPPGAAETKLRFMVTGHGQSPNSENAAEFISRSRTVTVNGSTFSDVLWRDNCYLNPCRPQGGTWIYSRAGWAPGDRVWPWEIDISANVTAGQTAVIDYTAQEYYNYTPDTGNTARHWVESQIIYYEPWTSQAVAHWQLNERTGLTASDSSGNHYDGQLFNMDQSSWAIGKQCGGLFFDGVDDYITITGFKGISGGNSRTCAAWIKTTQVSGEMICWGVAQTGQKWIIRTSETGSLRAEIANGYIYGTTPVNDGRWHHIAVVLQNDGTPDISEVVLYVDGVPESSVVYSSRTINTTDIQDVSIGVFALDRTRFFQGLMDEVRIYSRALADSEILALYESMALTSDIRTDGDVDFADFSALAEAWQSANAGLVDLNCDGFVDIGDFMILAEEWLDAI